jgi:hypothetical protein
MEKEIQAKCPNCRGLTLNIYYDDGENAPLAAMCDACAFKGYYMEGELEALPSVWFGVLT